MRLSLPASVTKRFVAVAIVLAAVGGFALIVGSHDVFAAHGLGSRLFGALLGVGGLTMLIAATGVFRGASWHVALSLVGSFAAFLVGVALLLAQLDEGRRGTMLVVWIGVVAAALVALVLSLGAGAPQVSQAVRRVQFVAVGGMLIGIAQFMYTTVYGPVPAGPHLTVSSTLERIGEIRGNDGLVAVKARITLENTSGRKIVVVDSVYRVAGEHVVAHKKTDDRFLKELTHAAASPSPGVNHVAAMRGIVERGGSLISAGQILERGFWFEPGESLTREFVVYAPARSYDLLRLSAVLTVADYGLLPLGDAPVFGPKRVPRTYYGRKYVGLDAEWKIRETSWVRRLTRGDNVLWVRWLLSGPRTQLWPATLAYVDAKGAALDPWISSLPSRVVRLSNEYGLLETYSSAELPLLRSAASG